MGKAQLQQASAAFQLPADRICAPVAQQESHEEIQSFSGHGGQHTECAGDSYFNHPAFAIRIDLVTDVRYDSHDSGNGEGFVFAATSRFPSHCSLELTANSNTRPFVKDTAGAMLEVNEHITIPESEFVFTFARSGGPGGQNVNKVNSKAMMQWDVLNSPSLPEDMRQRFIAAYSRRMTREGAVMINSQRYRDQARNVADCLARLRDLILQVAETPVQRKATKPSRGARQRRLSDKKAASERKQRRRPPSMD